MSELLEVYKLPVRHDRNGRYVAIYKDRMYNSWLPYAFENDKEAIEWAKGREKNLKILFDPTNEPEDDALDCYTGKYNEYLIWNRGQDSFKKQENDFIPPVAISEKEEQTVSFQPITLSTGVCYFCGVSNCYHLKDK